MNARTVTGDGGSATGGEAIVCIGASWGGVEALRVVLAGLPPSLPVPVCVVQHRGEDDALVSLSETFRRVTGMRVCEPDDKQPLEPGTVYLAPAGYHLMVDDDVLTLSVEDRVRWSRPSVDVLFETAAGSRGSGVVAVVLTGANDDGARGAQAVRGAGGTVLVQDPETAERREMPQATIDRAGASEVLALDSIADAVLRRVGSGA